MLDVFPLTFTASPPTLVLVVFPPTFIVLPPTLVLSVVGEEVGVILELVVLLFGTPSLDDTEENAN